MNRLLQRVLIGVAVVAIGLIGYMLAPRSIEQSPVRKLNDLYTLSVVGNEFIEPVYESTHPDSVAAYIRHEFHREVQVPEFEGLRLTGVGTLALSEGVEVPVLLYQDAQGIYTRLLVLNYAVLDQLRGKIAVDSTLFRDLEEEHRLTVRRVRAYYLGIWRERDDIYVLITLREPSEVITGLAQEPKR